MNSKIAALAGLVLVAAAAPALAQPEGNGPGAMRPDRGGMMARIDADGDGAISAEEFADIGVGDLIKADADGNGELSVAEIKAAMEARRDRRIEAMAKRRFDIDGDGKITVSELKDRQDKRFALLDANNDGKVTREEFRAMRGEFRMGGRGFDGDDRGGRGMDDRGWGHGFRHHGWR